MTWVSVGNNWSLQIYNQHDNKDGGIDIVWIQSTCINQKYSPFKTIPTSLLSPSLPQRLAASDVFSISVILWFLKCYINGIMQCVIFDKIVLLSIILLSSRLYITNSFPFLAQRCARCVWMYHSLIIHALKGIWLVSNFWLWWVKLL